MEGLGDQLSQTSQSSARNLLLRPRPGSPPHPPSCWSAEPSPSEARDDVIHAGGHTLGEAQVAWRGREERSRGPRDEKCFEDGLRFLGPIGI